MLPAISSHWPMRHLDLPLAHAVISPSLLLRSSRMATLSRGKRVIFSSGGTLNEHPAVSWDLGSAGEAKEEEAVAEMNRRNDPNPFHEEDMNPFAASYFALCGILLLSLCAGLEEENGAGSKSCLPPLASEPLGYGNRHDAIVDIPLDTMNDSKKKARDLATGEADLKRREKEKIQALQQSQESCSFQVLLAFRNDIYSQVLGEDKPDHLRGVGIGPTPSTVWENTTVILKEENEMLGDKVKDLEARIARLERKDAKFLQEEADSVGVGDVVEEP
ncbi:hypothetical protein Taro_056103 [Colocasia esculenta]|uniref:Uncharacterized protein n=1 Tax=Colocasia esculenta TaxID=4460 RepID=A0A843XVC0_COLES|nr:hypothetical protein [Colocasia esculenta]